MQPAFIHLRLHSEFSLVDGTVKIKALARRLVELNMPAIAVTEHANLFSLVKFYKAARDQGIKPIAGADVLVYNPDDPTAPYRLTLLVNNNVGYVTLTELVSKAYQEGQHLGVPMLRYEWIVANHQGLIAMSGAMDGDIGKALVAGKTVVAQQLAKQWSDLFKNAFYLELQRVGKADEEAYIDAALELAALMGLPVVATNDVRFLHKKDFAAHEVRVCINQGRVLDDDRRPKDYTEQQYLRSTEDMQQLFADIPEALENSVEIAKRCTISLTLGENFLPDFPVPAGMTLSEYMTLEAEKGLEERLVHYPAIGKGTDEENRQVYYQRLDFELKMISQMGFPGYFMIVADFIQWAKNNLIPVGPGRGSGAGSLVAYALKITDLDPIKFDLLFERFLNPERVSMPDFDIDFCMDRRDEVIDYVARHYGRDHVAQIITYGSMAAKAVIRDVGRVLGFPYGFVDRLAKLIPFEIGMTLTKALTDSPDLKQLYDTEEEVTALIDMALSLEGTVRNAGKHAGGVVISPTKLTDFTPLYCEEDGSNLVTQFDKDDVEAVGLVKFDFLGLRTLTIIDWALQTINDKKRLAGEDLVDITTIPRDDQASYVLLKNGLTTAVFQLESRGMKELIKKLKPDCFDDIIALVALFRPGPLESGMVDDYINVKHGAKAEYAHPILVPILKPTNGVILYQEQVMQIAREMALYTLGGADMLRRAMGKKKPEEMAKERGKFLEGSVQNNVEEDIATYVFDLMEKFAGYGFNKSHSAAYALVAYQTAWLKAHYPSAFMAAVLSSDMDNTDKVVILIEECRQMKQVILPPAINMSMYKFTVNEASDIIYGLGAIKGVG
ncbi:MAG: DNA polymerase III subunit alpha, partial [Methylococcaceae bacterium]